MALKDMIPFVKKNGSAKQDNNHPFSIFRREFDDLFDNFLNNFQVQQFDNRAGTFMPKIDVSENEKEIKINAELPGMDEKDIDVSLSRNNLIISGEKKEEKENRGKDYYQVERTYGSFSRTIPLPVEVETDKVEAKFKKGVLTITVAKKEKTEKETKKIKVSAH